VQHGLMKSSSTMHDPLLPVVASRPASRIGECESTRSSRTFWLRSTGDGNWRHWRGRPTGVRVPWWHCRWSALRFRPLRQHLDARNESVSLVELAADFREHVNLTEGPDGLYRELLKSAPRLSGAVARLTSEHVLINDEVDPAGRGQRTRNRSVRRPSS
jgi:hypothetical protein